MESVEKREVGVVRSVSVDVRSRWGLQIDTDSSGECAMGSVNEQPSGLKMKKCPILML